MARKKTLFDLYQMKQRGEPVAWITAYDAPTAACAQAAGIDMLLVGAHAPLEAERAVLKLRKSLGRELNLVNMTTEEFDRKSGKDQFLKSVFEKKTIKVI